MAIAIALNTPPHGFAARTYPGGVIRAGWIGGTSPHLQTPSLSVANIITLVAL